MTLLMQVDKLRGAFLDLVFPPRCIGCRVGEKFLCDSCLEALPRLEPPFCEHCGIPIAGGSFCPECLSAPPTIDGIRSLLLHQGIARDIVHYLKYKNLKALARPLAELMAEYLESNPLPVDVLLATPMHSRRMRVRGYNQAELLARELSLLVHIPTDEGLLTRSRNTPSQVSLGAEARRNNVNGAFQCGSNVFEKKSVLIIDDVCTTGATLNACAIVLKEAGAASVWALTISREC